MKTYIDKEVTNENLHEVLGYLTVDGGAVVDNDGVSLYPSASTTMGIPMGHPKSILNTNRGTFIEWLLKERMPFWVACSWKSKWNMDVHDSCMKIDGKNTWMNGEFNNIVIDDVKMRFMLETGEYELKDFQFKQGQLVYTSINVITHFLDS